MLDTFEGLILSFMGVQERRSNLYSGFSDGFREYLRSKDEPRYRSLIETTTVSFNECSSKVGSFPLCCRRNDAQSDVQAILLNQWS